jgi:dimethylargininase
VADGVVLANPGWVDVETFAGFEVLTVDPAEPFAANVLRLGRVVLVPQAHPRTAQRLADRGLAVELIEADELAKAEGGLTCCSLLVASAA